MNIDFFEGMDDLTPTYETIGTSVAETREQFPAVWALAGEALAMAKLLVPLTHARRKVGENKWREDVFPVWNKIRMYQQNSFILIIGRQLDEGLAVMRMAMELTMIMKAIHRSPENLNKWITGTYSKSKSFEADARMALEHPTEKQIYDSYKYCCRFGVHGHLTSYLHSVPGGPAWEAHESGAGQIAQRWFIDFMAPHKFAFETMHCGNDWEGVHEWRIVMLQMEMKLLAAVETQGFFK